MKTEISIRTTKTCPTCKGEGEIYNPEWQAFSDAMATHEQQHGSLRGPARDDFEASYWQGKGHGQFGPWDFQRCTHCEGDGDLVSEQYISIGELKALIAIS